jgi:hypothetical protein
VME